jgi:exodeoxyribonuclease-1
MDNSIYWYDYETFGIDPRQDRIVQFAGLRTDEQLNVIGDPLVMFCKPADDVLPDPAACMITGITPQRALAKGLPEPDFIAAIHCEFSRPNTCIAGYNSIRFDDEFTRNTLYRNFFNPYAHEWQHNNSRWDLIDIVRLTRALRPEGIGWPVDDHGHPSIRLELLTRANNISHEAAHDAMSDVYATIAVARLIRDKQPRLYDYMYDLRRKQAVSQLLNVNTREAVLHVSSRYSAERSAIAMVMPICMHPVNKNAIVVYDLAQSPQDFIDTDAVEIAARLYTAVAELPDDVSRIPLKLVHINKCPVVVPLKTMDAASATRLQIDIALCAAHRTQILDHIEMLTAKCREVFSEQNFAPAADPDLQLYSGGFFSDADSGRMDAIRRATADELTRLVFSFDDKRLSEMLFRYRARNYPQTLAADEQTRWQAFLKQKFTDPGAGPRTLNRYLADIEALQQAPDTTGLQLVVLEALLEYAKMAKKHIS